MYLYANRKKENMKLRGKSCGVWEGIGGIKWMMHLIKK